MNGPLYLLGFFLCVNGLALLALFRSKARGRREYRKAAGIRIALSDALFRGHTEALERLLKAQPLPCLRAWRDLRSTLSLAPAEEAPVARLFAEAGLEARLIRRLRSRSRLRRYEAAQLIRPILSDAGVAALAAALRHEAHENLRMVYAKDLADAGSPEGYDAIAASLESCGMEYYRSMRTMLAASDARFLDWAASRLSEQAPCYRIAILSGAKSHVDERLRAYVESSLSHDDPRVKSCAIDAAEARYPGLLALKATATGADASTRRAAVRDLARTQYPLDLPAFSSLLTDPETEDVAAEALARYVTDHPDEAERLLAYLDAAKDPVLRRGLALAISARLPFLLVASVDYPRLRGLVLETIAAKKSAGLIAFLNANRDGAMRHRIFEWIAEPLQGDPAFRGECAAYLRDELRAELGIGADERPRSGRKIPLTMRDRIGLIAILVFIGALPIAAVAFGLAGDTIGRFSILARESYKIFIGGFAAYAIALNAISLGLLALASGNLAEQERYWDLMDKDFLFTPGILPSISILAPAYNEEKTVVQSVYSLLTLEYPDYQVIVINDGSSDDTIGRLKVEFELERIDPLLAWQVPTAPIRGIYRSPRHRRLLVIDKDNGGKADALNAGINLANREYLCSIDSDSLLEPDALLRMCAQILQSDVETIAVGGNILPVNGCTVERGMLQKVQLSGSRIVRLQTIEYLRSFIAGRLGWARANALLIISGAFGLFRRSRVLEIGGYMTGRGEFRKDTVGEDMELVVRLVRRMRETRRRYRIRYAATANCWTEVPEDMASLYKQRDRWHRGLVEIMTFHRKMLFNPRYGSAGLLAFPYFVFFEFIGPFYEFLGYPLLLIGFATGVLHLEVFVVMFSAIMLFGLAISLVSLVLSEKGIVYFRPRELLTLLGHSLLENFGFRQLMGWVRVFALVGMLFKNKGWQKLERKGFSIR